MNTEALREQIRAQLRQALQRQQAAAPASAAWPQPPLAHAVVVPLRLSRASDTQALTQLFQRLAASPALLHAASTGLLRFDWRVDTSAVQAVQAIQAGAGAMAATTTIDPAACCSSCKQGQACECTGDTCGTHKHHHTAEVEAVPELQGVIGEKLVKTLAASVKTVRIHPKAVMTPLGKDALRKRGITLDRGAKT